MRLDIRLPIGVLFSILGLILVVFGFISDPTIYKRSLEINVNVWWGIILLIFGSVLLFFSWSANKKTTE